MTARAKTAFTEEGLPPELRLGQEMGNSILTVAGSSLIWYGLLLVPLGLLLSIASTAAWVIDGYAMDSKALQVEQAQYLSELCQK